MRNIYFTLIMVSVFMISLLDVNAQDTVRISFTGMNPHIGQSLYFRVVDKSNGLEVGRTSVLVTVPDFTLGVGGIQPDSSYNLDFYADLTKNGRYDFPGDHAWRITLDSVQGDTTVPFAHNTNFTDIAWVYQLTVALSNMTPHLGENLYFALKNKTGWEFERKKLTEDTANYNVSFNGIIPDSSYLVDFFADHPSNGRYDFPGDHAWRITVDSVKGDTVIPFVHNTNFTDIAWNYKLTVNFTDMTPHVNQPLKLYLRNNITGAFIDSTAVTPIAQPDFSVNLYSIRPDSSYNVDFWVDFSGNGMYDAPPTDHAWRIELMDVQGDTLLNFAHNTDFTDIGVGVITGIDDINESGFSTYPNPVSDELIITSKQNDRNITSIKIFNSTGRLVIDQSGITQGPEVRVSVSSLKPGLYILSISNDVSNKKLKFVKQ